MVCCASVRADDHTLKTRHVVLVTVDGLRPRELFGGLDPMLIHAPDRAGIEHLVALRQRYWRDTPERRREALLPFFWKTLAANGVVIGNNDLESHARLTNRYHFSYPGYAELLCGQAQEAITSNDPVPSPHETILEYIRRKNNLPRTAAAAFCSWRNFIGITAHTPNAIVCNAGYDAIEPGLMTPGMKAANESQFLMMTPWDTVRHDWVTYTLAEQYLKHHTPEFLYIALGETDDWAHARRYDRVIEAANLFDQCLERLWNTLQTLDQYRGNTTLIVTTDHGRGLTEEDWVSHGAKIPGSDRIWIAIIGPDTPAGGEVHGGDTYTMNQIAATILKFYGLDRADFNPDSGKPIDLAFGR